jgi:hypothetical protein
MNSKGRSLAVILSTERERFNIQIDTGTLAAMLAATLDSKTVPLLNFTGSPKPEITEQAGFALPTWW